MILKKITLTNIRSYTEPTTIEFAKGSSLFEGDIGSGKSTILYGIEFALFGLGDIEGEYLLRNGEKQGSVLLEFEVNGKTFAACRTLVKKGQGVSQGEGYIVEDGEQTEYGVTEMKARILQILNFNERVQAKTSSLVYRYAIFTPQEMMKEVIQQKPKDRLDTLRRAFGIEEYSMAIKNSELLARELRSQVKHIITSVAELPTKLNELNEENERIEKEQSELELAQKEEKELASKVKAKKAKISELQPIYERFVVLGQSISQLKGQLEEKKREKADEEGRKAELDKEREDIEKAEKSLKELEPKYSRFIKAKDRLIELEPTIEDYRKLESNIEKSKSKISKEKEHLQKEISKLSGELENDEADLKGRRHDIRDIEAIRARVEELTELAKKVKPLATKIETLRSKIDSINARIDGENEKLSEKQRELADIKKIGVGAACPLCKQRLTKQHLATLSGDYQSTFDKIKEKIAKLEEEKKSFENELRLARKDEQELEAHQKELNRLSPKLAEIEEKQRSITSDSKKIDGKKQKLRELKEALKNEQYALEERKQLKQFSLQLEKIAGPKQEYDELKAEVTSLEKAKIESLHSQLESKVSRKETVLKQIEKTSQKLLEIDARIKKVNEELASSLKEYDEKKDVKTKIDTLTGEKDALEIKQGEKARTIAARKATIAQLARRVSELRQTVDSMEAQVRQREALQQILVWLEEYFVPCLRDVEQYVMASYNEEFDRSFQKWFMSLLESGDIAVSIDDAFTPMVMHNGLELDVNSLSGGEKTSVALAYRLALNMMVKKACNALNSNLLILDEPTDGFSHEQLNRLRDVLEDLNCEQVILVSHEKQLEGFVDRVYRITKDNNISKVEKIIA
jgi:exonuclease SbcC